MMYHGLQLSGSLPNLMHVLSCAMVPFLDLAVVQGCRLMHLTSAAHFFPSEECYCALEYYYSIFCSAQADLTMHRA